MLVSIILGSKSDEKFADKISAVLNEYGVKSEVNILSAHKVPEKLFAFIEKNNQKHENLCYITVAGRSNGLSGVCAASSIHPVIACPPFADKDDFIVNINSTLQMPSKVPSLTVLDPENAALAAIRILALSDKNLRAKVEQQIKKMKAEF